MVYLLVAYRPPAMNKSLAKLLVAAAFAVSLVSLASCNRGYGCPTDLKVEQPSGLE